MSGLSVAADGLPPKWWELGVSEDDSESQREKSRERLSAEIANAVVDTVDWLEKNQRSSRMSQYVISSRLYGGVDYWGDLLGVPTKTPANAGWINDSLKFNICSSVTDTVTAKISQEKPQAYFLTQGGDYKQQRQAKKLTKFCIGVFEQNDGHKLAVRCFRDAAVLGDSFVEVSAQKVRGKTRIVYSYVPAWELFVDEAEAASAPPRQMYRRKPVDRRVLKRLPGLTPEQLRAIDKLDPVRGRTTHRSIGDNVWVYEAWHLPSAPEANDGRHVIAAKGVVLSDGVWTREDFPFARMAWNPRMVGYWSQGLVEQVQNIQLEINKLLITISRSIRLGGSFKWLVATGSKVVKEHLSNEVGAVIYYTGTKPECVAPAVLQPEIVQQYERLKRDGYEQAGVSQLASTATKPAGLNSGVAIREYNDTASDRFATIAGAWNDFHLDLARQTIACAKEAGGIEVKVSNGRSLIAIKSSELNLKDDAYVMRLFAIASLPEEPAGRLQQITEWMQAGVVTLAVGRKLLGYPDIEAETTLQNAAEEVVNQALDRLIDEDDYQLRLDPLTNIQMFYEKSLETYNRGLLEDLDDTKMEKLRVFIDQCRQALSALAGPAANQPDATGQPQAVPQAPPVSDMLPNSPGGGSGGVQPAAA